MQDPAQLVPVNIPLELKKQLDEIANFRQQPPYSIIAKALEKYLAEEKANLPTEPVFNYDLDRMKNRVENQEFIRMPDDLKTTQDFKDWLASIAS